MCGSPCAALLAGVVRHVEWEDLVEVEVRVVEQDLIPCVGQLVLPNVPVKVWIIGPYV